MDNRGVMRSDLRKMLFLQSCYTFSNTGDAASGGKRRGEKKIHNETQCLQADAVAKISKVWLASEGPPSSSAGCLGLAGCSTAAGAECEGCFFVQSGLGRRC